MILLFILLVLVGKAVLAKRYAPEVVHRFAWRPWDAAWVAAWVLVNGQFVAAGLLCWVGVEQERAGWEIPVGVMAYAGGHALHLAAMVVNQEFRPEIIAPKEPCRHCLYRWFRHPGYIGLVYASLGQTLLLGYRVLATFTFAYAALLVYRIVKEEYVLCQHLQES